MTTARDSVRTLRDDQTPENETTVKQPMWLQTFVPDLSLYYYYNCCCCCCCCCCCYYYYYYYYNNNNNNNKRKKKKSPKQSSHLCICQCTVTTA